MTLQIEEELLMHILRVWCISHLQNPPNCNSAYIPVYIVNTLNLHTCMCTSLLHFTNPPLFPQFGCCACALVVSALCLYIYLWCAHFCSCPHSSPCRKCLSVKMYICNITYNLLLWCRLVICPCAVSRKLQGITENEACRWSKEKENKGGKLKICFSFTLT